jgi:hypothetical protein
LKFRRNPVTEVPEISGWETKPDKPSAEDLERMKEYNLDDAYEIGTEVFRGFVCKGCGLLYPSVEDRARKPEGCHGCFLKSAHG